MKRATLQYLWLTIKHKAFVLRAGLWTKAPLWRLVIHDWSKFMPSEAPHYGRQFFGDKGDPAGFARAWLHHQNSNPHHWEYWIPRSAHNRGDGDKEPLEMPEWAVREMAADWMGASRVYEGRWPTPESWPWLEKNLGTIRVHPNTIDAIVRILAEAFERKASA